MQNEMLPIGKYTVRPAAMLLARILAKTAITPNQITAAGLVTGIISAALITFGQKYTIAAGGIVILLFWMLDMTDGQVGRLKNMCSDFGAWFDANTDQIVENLLYISISVGGYLHTNNTIYLLIGIFIFSGKFMYFQILLSRQSLLAKSNGKYGPALVESVKRDKHNLFISTFLFWCNYDVRIHFLSLCALINRLEYALIFYAVYFNFRWMMAYFYIIYNCRKENNSSVVC
jgi:phosphatidylglycerophosphate synthase